MGLNEDILKYILEIKGSYKIGKYMPGTNIPIVNEEIIKISLIICFYFHGIYQKHLLVTSKKRVIRENLLFLYQFLK